MILRVALCPFCSLHHASLGRWIVCDATRSVRRPDGGNVTRVAPMVCRLVHALLCRMDKVTSVSDISVVLWPNADDVPDYYRNVIVEYVAQGRRVLPIVNIQGRGYVVDG